MVPLLILTEKDERERANKAPSAQPPKKSVQFTYMCKSSCYEFRIEQQFFSSNQKN